MKKLFILVCIFSISYLQAQDKSPTFEKEGNLVKATYYYEDGSIEKQGFFKNKKLEGTWVSFDQKGNKTAVAHYANGAKVGKWLMWQGETLRKINYENNIIANVEVVKDSRVANQ